MVKTTAILPWLILASNAALALPQAPVSYDSSCTPEALAPALPDNAELLSATSVEKGGSYGEGAANKAYPTNPTNLSVAVCAVVVNVTTSPSSSFRFGLFLPSSAEAWNSRYLTIGNGAWAGGINWIDMGARLAYGFAVASTDTGHNDSTMGVSWALNAPEAQKDFGYRSIHGTTAIAKDLVRAFYGTAAAHSYYAGCSTGGRQGLRAVQYDADDFDGILVGAPAWWTAHQQPWGAWLDKEIANASYSIGSKVLPALAAEAMAQCDGVDGLVDGIISAPDLCSLNMSALLCTSTEDSSSSCLTPEQVESATKIYNDYYIHNGTEMGFPGLNIGTELGWGGITPSALWQGYIQYFLLGDPSWDMHDYNETIMDLADERDPGNSSAVHYAAMGTYRDAGGKVLMYHGLADPGIPTRSSTLFYGRVADALGQTPDELDDWFRYLLIPGMGHCSGTNVDAPWFIGGAEQAARMGADVGAVPGAADARHDALLALVEWVEGGRPVESVVATTWRDQTDPASGVLRQRPVCAHPRRAVYGGMGDVDVASSWSCSGSDA